MKKCSVCGPHRNLLYSDGSSFGVQGEKEREVWEVASECRVDYFSCRLCSSELHLCTVHSEWVWDSGVSSRESHDPFDSITHHRIYCKYTAKLLILNQTKTTMWILFTHAACIADLVLGEIVYKYLKQGKSTMPGFKDGYFTADCSGASIQNFILESVWRKYFSSLFWHIF